MTLKIFMKPPINEFIFYCHKYNNYFLLTCQQISFDKLFHFFTNIISQDKNCSYAKFRKNLCAIIFYNMKAFLIKPYSYIKLSYHIKYIKNPLIGSLALTLIFFYL